MAYSETNLKGGVMKLRKMLLDHAERIDTECESTQQYLDEAKQSWISEWLYGEELDRLQTQVYKKQIVSGVLELVAELLPKR